MNINGRSLELFFIDGRANGMLTAEVFNWTGHVLRIPRTQIKDGLARKEARYTGVYLLFGDKDGVPTAYVGEAEDMGERLRNHVAGKDWWDDAVLITAAGDALHKAHVKYLESRLVEIAKDVGATPLENGNVPTRSSLSKAGEANMESFLDTLLMVLPAIRVDAFLDKRRRVDGVSKSTDEKVAVFECKLPRHEITASAVLRGGEMIVKAGSEARSSWIADRSKRTHYSNIFDELCSNGTLVMHATGKDVRVFSQDYAFTSPSAAAAVVAGRSTNGRTAWIEKKSGQTYAEWEEAQLNKVTPE